MNDELNRVPYLTIAQAHEVGINQSAGSQGQTYPFQTCSLCIVSSLDSSLSFGQGYFQTDSSPGCASTMMTENRRQPRDRKWPEQSGWLLVLALHSRGAKAGEGKSWTLEFAQLINKAEVIRLSITKWTLSIKRFFSVYKETAQLRAVLWLLFRNEDGKKECNDEDA